MDYRPLAIVLVFLAVQTLPLVRAATPPGATFHDCSNCPQMMALTTGAFVMGVPYSDGWDERGSPEHRVVISRPFAIGVNDVTVAEYRAFADETHRPAGACNFLDGQRRWSPDAKRTWRNPGFPQNDRHPVVCVSWLDAQAYASWLSAKTGARYRLPSEAEWEYAARGGTVAAFYWGDQVSHDHANYGLEECYPCGGRKEGLDRWYFTSPVGSFNPNPFGLYDMSGDVWQWTQDCMHYGYEGAPTDGSAWMAADCRDHVLRGGAWNDPGANLGFGVRNPWPADDYNYANGLRVARDLD
jgi:formylglycine-generating enzyme required for sulfatase activity